ncbi:8569_t:CDS:2 [Ambispora leptoticha]|uniref:8569_t:CDS:1 n=1 Tax=Ambispora leptoticha TaxID=144679 RepID=A0A9N9G8H6_9GLOM|nr:8569_t:CDS:2 [Ambispora leptoticha]
MNNQPNLKGTCVTKPIVYNKYKTCGHFGQAVNDFCEWLDKKVKDEEEPKVIDGKNVSVWICLFGHSMGGLVAADAILKYRELGAKISPKIVGLLAYDTPYYGLNYGLECEIVNDTCSCISKISLKVKDTHTTSKSKVVLGFCAGAMICKHMGVIKDSIKDHFEFISALLKKDESKKRLDTLIQDSKLIFHCFYNLIPADDRAKTFISLPLKHMRQYFSPHERDVSDVSDVSHEVIAHIASMFDLEIDHSLDKLIAHITMFNPETNHEYNSLADHTTHQLLKMLENSVFRK